jgi:hypothetical protein
MGNIPAKYKLRETNSLFGPRFHFNPGKGIVNVNEQILIRVRFNPDTLGDFNESFIWELEVY